MCFPVVTIPILLFCELHDIFQHIFIQGVMIDENTRNISLNEI